MTKEELINSLSPEMREKAKTCKTTEELYNLFDEYGMELTDELLDAVAGGFGDGEQLPCRYQV